MASISLNSRFERNPDLVWTDMDGETVMMSIERDQYFGLGGVGSRIWEALGERVTVAEICSLITAEFEVDAETCQGDVLAFLAELLELELIRRR